MLQSVWGPLESAGLATPLASAAVPRAMPGLGACDVHETDAGWTISMDAPGVPKADMDISIADGVLTVSGSRSEEKTVPVGGEGEAGKKAGQDAVLSERVWGSFQRSFRLPADADADGVKAALDHGVLRLDVPRKATAEPASKKVAIQ